MNLARNAHFIARLVPRIRQAPGVRAAADRHGPRHTWGAARLMYATPPIPPLGPDAIETRAATLAARIAAHAESAEDPDRRAFLEVLRTRLDLSWLALEAAQPAMLRFGVRGYLVGSEAARRLREAQFVAIITPSVKHILAELARR